MRELVQLLMDRRPVLVTGGSGQLASALAMSAGVPVVRVGRPDFDFDRPDSIAAAFATASPWLVVNAAAYTAVDAAETDAEAAYRANRDGPERLAQLCAAAGVPLIHISTDYVFDGAKGTPYIEADPVAPQGVYGASKLAGEASVLARCPHTIVLRTSWVYSAVGRNFVLTMLNLAKTRDHLRVVADQVGCPTAAGDLAAAILAIATRIRAEGWQQRFGGVFHAAGSGWTSWHGLACAVFEEAGRHGAPIPQVDPIPAAEYPTKAKRPADSRLDCSKLATVFNVTLPSWRPSLARTIDTIFATR